jgi:hypothetical protein
MIGTTRSRLNLFANKLRNVNLPRVQRRNQCEQIPSHCCPARVKVSKHGGGVRKGGQRFRVDGNQPGGLAWVELLRSQHVRYEAYEPLPVEGNGRPQGRCPKAGRTIHRSANVAIFRSAERIRVKRVCGIEHRF